MSYRLLIKKKDGDVSKHLFDTYDELDYNAVFCRFSSNIVYAAGQEETLMGWKTLFTIGENK